jgi:hypothetical protein
MYLNVHSPKSAPSIQASHWWRGGFRRAYLARDDKTARQWHEDFFRTFLGALEQVAKI